MSSGPVIGLARRTSDGRELTGLDYAQDADPRNPIFHITLIDTSRADEMVAAAGLTVPERWDYAPYHP